MEQDTQPRKTKRVPFGYIALAIFAVGGLAACGSTSTTATSSPAGSGTTAISPAANTGGGTVQGTTVSTAQDAMFGKILVSGKTLYTLAPSSTPCDATCLQTWPELVLPKGVAMATAGTGVNASSLGTVNRGGGVLQVTYAGKPLYYFSQDTAVGQVKGNVTDKWGKWTDVVASAPSSTGHTGTTAPAGSGGAGF